MANLGKLSILASVCFAMIVFGACGGGSGGGGGGYSPGGQVVYPGCEKYLHHEGGSDNTGTSTSTNTSNSAYDSCTKTATSSTTVTSTGSWRYTVTNGLTYFQTGTETGWEIYTGQSTSTSTQ